MNAPKLNPTVQVPSRKSQISCVIAAYKQSPFLEQCIESLKAQDHPCELRMASSTPSDFLTRVANSHGIPLEINPHRAGIAADWNFALRCGSAPIAVVCHQDDIYEPNFVSSMAGVWDQEPGCLMAFSDHMELLPDGTRRSGLNLWVKRRLVHRAFARSQFVEAQNARRRLLSLGNPICCPGVAINRVNLPEFEFDADWEINLDWEAWDRICTRPGRIAYIDQVLLAHRIHPGSETSAGIGDQRRQIEDAKMFRRYWPAWISRLLMLPYSLSYASNKISSA
ncbi:glycosyltransferase family 2 protein [Ideonella sp.]|uniref:glycosyltransferase family 2 protein n=1 Tax=Ideonella sp. TaxID=1929293 RepID=UPI003BB72A73